MQISGKVALVSGGASGLGLATVHRLLNRGANVVILDLPSSKGEVVVGECTGNAVFIGADVVEEDQVQHAVDVAIEMGELSIVVNCAGIGNAIRVVSKNGPFPLFDFQRIIDVNLTGPFNVIRLAADAMTKNPSTHEERGVIVNTASIAAFDGQIGQAAYSASKAALVGMTLPLARDLAVHRIRVNTVAPGFFRTPLVDLQPDMVQTSLVAQVPHPSRAGEPSEFAALVEHVIENPMLNGETIRLDGAMRMGAR